MNRGDLIVVTGGCGFIGTNLTLKFLESGARVRVFDNLASGEWSPVLKSSAEFIRGDVRDAAAVVAAITGASKVVHLAAFGSVMGSIRDPLPNFEVNAAGTLNVLQACVAARVGKLVFASTGGAALGDHVGPVNEDVLPKPISPYGASKVAGEVYCHAFAKAFGLSTVCLRFANIYGPYSDHKTGAITKFLQAIQKNEPIEIFGDGNSTRDFLYVEDLCEGIVRALNVDIAPGSIIHLASGVETSINELVRITLQVTGKSNHPIHRMPLRRGEVRNNVASFGLAKELLGFSPSIDLPAGMRFTWTWLNRETVK